MIDPLPGEKENENQYELYEQIILEKKYWNG